MLPNLQNEPARLGSNENLLGPSPKALKAIEAWNKRMHIYPVTEDVGLTAKLVAHIGQGLTADQVVLGNGSGDVLGVIMQAYLERGDEVVMATATFALYRRVAASYRATVIEIPNRDDFQIDFDGMVEAITKKTKLIFLCNPNNPTGMIINRAEMQQLLDRIPKHVTVIVDEAYVDFADDPEYPNMMDFINAGYPIIVTRTFSKLYGLASLKAGFGFGNLDRIAPVRAIRQVYESGLMMYHGAAAALEDEAHIVDTLEMARSGRAYLYSQFERLRLDYIPTQALFVTLKNLPLPAETIVAEALEHHNVILRDAKVFGMPGHVRVSIGRQEDNERGIAAIESILKKHLG